MLTRLLLALALLLPLPTAAQDALRVATVERAPFAMTEDGALTGFSIELTREIADRLDREVAFEPQETFAAMLDAVRAGEVDAAVANISITASREETMDFSLSIYDSGMRVLTAAGGEEPSWLSLIWDSGIPLLIFGALGILLVVAHLMWWLEGGGHPYFRDSYPAGVWDAFWWAFIIVTMGGFENERPRRAWAQAFAVFWIVVGLFFVSSFTAMITTAMTVDRLQAGITGWQDLKGKRVGIATGTSFSEFADANGLAYRPYEDFRAAVAAVERGELDATIGDAPVVEFYARGPGAGKVVPAGAVFAPEKLGAAFPEGSALREPFNRALLRVIEDGTYAALAARYFSVD